MALASYEDALIAIAREFVCPISFDIIYDLVIVKGHAFECSEITKVIKDGKPHPKTREKITAMDILPPPIILKNTLQHIRASWTKELEEISDISLFYPQLTPALFRQIVNNGTYAATIADYNSFDITNLANTTISVDGTISSMLWHIANILPTEKLDAIVCQHIDKLTDQIIIEVIHKAAASLDLLVGNV